MAHDALPVRAAELRRLRPLGKLQIMCAIDIDVGEDLGRLPRVVQQCVAAGCDGAWLRSSAAGLPANRPELFAFITKTVVDVEKLRSVFKDVWDAVGTSVVRT